MNCRSLLVGLLASTMACGGAAAGASGTTSAADATKTYPIRLHRHGHVGDRARIVCEAVEDNTSVMHLASSGKEIRHEHKTQRSLLDGTLTTVALDERQDELRATLDVASLVVDDAVLLHDKRVDIMKARREEDAILTVDGAPASAEVRKALKDLLSLSVGGPTDDDIFGTKESQLVGAHWPIDGERARADLLADTDLASKKVSGETTFVGVEHVGNIDALDLRAEMQIDGIEVPVPRGATCEPGRAKAIMKKLVPVDENRGVLESHMEFEMTARIHAPTESGDEVIGDIVATSRQDDRSTPL